MPGASTHPLRSLYRSRESHPSREASRRQDTSRSDKNLIVGVFHAHRSERSGARLARAVPAGSRLGRKGGRGGAGTASRRRRPLLQRSEEHTSELQSLTNLVCSPLLEKKK